MGQTTVTHDSHAAHEHDHHEQSFIMKYFFSTDHKIIGLQYMFTGMFMAIVGGREAMRGAVRELVEVARNHASASRNRFRR